MIVVLDDPVSSLDQDNMYSAHSYIMERVREVAQVIILTHHYPYFLRVRETLKYLKKEIRSFFMLKNIEEDGKRICSLFRLDPLLQSHKDEYIYLFQELYKIAYDNCEEPV